MSLTAMCSEQEPVTRLMINGEAKLKKAKSSYDEIKITDKCAVSGG
jgi:hypothetical protein